MAEESSLLRKLEQGYNVFSPQKQKIHRAKKRDSNILPLYTFRSNWRKVTKQEKNRKGGNKNFSLFRLLTVQWQKILLVTVLLYRIIKKKEPRLVYLKSKYVDTLCRLLPVVRKYTGSIGNRPEGDLASRTHTALIITSILSQCFMEFLLPVDRRRGEADDP